MGTANLTDRRLHVATNLRGSLSPEVRARVVAVVENPTPGTWDDAKSIFLCARPMLTLWQAVLAASDYDVTSGPPYVGHDPRPPWPVEDVPTVAQLLAGIEYARQRLDPSDGEG